MPEYVKWCNWFEEDALGNNSNVLFGTFKYSENTQRNNLDFLGVKSTIFKTMHFLIVSAIYINLEILLKVYLNCNSSNQLISWFPCWVIL